MPNFSLKSLICLTLLTVFTQTSFADTGLSAEESDTIVKEDIAAIQVLTEVCPALTSNNPKIQTAIQGMTQTFLKDLQNASTTIEQLKQDAEYQKIYKEAQADATSVEQSEQKSACEDLLNM